MRHIFLMLNTVTHAMQNAYEGKRIAHNDGRLAIVQRWCATLSDVPRGGDRSYESAGNYPYFRTPSAAYPQGIGGYVLTTLTPQTRRHRRRRQNAPYTLRRVGRQAARTYCGRCVIDHLGFDYLTRCKAGRPTRTTACSVCGLSTQSGYFTTSTR